MAGVSSEEGAPLLGSESKNNGGKGDLTCEDLSDTVFRKHRLKKFHDIMKDAESLELTWGRTFSALAALVSMLFNIYVVLNNFYTRPLKVDGMLTRGYLRLVVAWVELVSVGGLVVFALSTMWAGKTALKHARPKEEMGANVHDLTKSLSEISKFSMIRGTVELKNFVSWALEDYQRSIHERDAEYWETHKVQWEKVSFILRVCGRMLFLLAAVAAFVLKLSQIAFVADKPLRQFSIPQWFTLMGFLNNMVSLHEPKEIAKNALYTFIFAGADSNWQSDELQLLHNFETILYWHIVSGSYSRGILIILALTPKDLQRLLVEDVDVTSRKDV